MPVTVDLRMTLAPVRPGCESSGLAGRGPGHRPERALDPPRISIHRGAQPKSRLGKVQDAAELLDHDSGAVAGDLDLRPERGRCGPVRSSARRRGAGPDLRPSTLTPAARSRLRARSGRRRVTLWAKSARRRRVAREATDEQVNRETRSGGRCGAMRNGRTGRVWEHHQYAHYRGWRSGQGEAVGHDR